MVDSVSTTLIAATAGLIGATIGFATNYWVARRNLKKEISLKIAEYRISWINNLGDQISIFLASAIRVGFRLEGHEEKDLNGIRQEMIRSATRVELLMNHQDEDYPALKELMKKIDKIVISESKDDVTKRNRIKEMTVLDKEFVNLSNRILKREWSRTKKHLREDTVEVSALRSENGIPKQVS